MAVFFLNRKSDRNSYLPQMHNHYFLGLPYRNILFLNVFREYIREREVIEALKLLEFGGQTCIRNPGAFREGKDSELFLSKSQNY